MAFETAFIAFAAPWAWRQTSVQQQVAALACLVRGGRDESADPPIAAHVRSAHHRQALVLAGAT
jgi:hypothetical protein